MSIFIRRSPDLKATPRSLARALIIMLYEQGWGLSPAELAACLKDLPEEARDLVKGWSGLYLAWLYRRLIAKEHGSKMAEDMMLQARVMIQDLGSAGKALKGAYKDLEAAFAKFDEALAWYEKGKDSQPQPFLVYVGTTILFSDPRSPSYRKDPGELAGRVGWALEQIDVKAAPTLSLALKMGGSDF